MLKLLQPCFPFHITQRFGAKSPAYLTYHRGTDIRVFNVPKQEVKAAQDGEVIYVDSKSTGNWYNGTKYVNGKKTSAYGVHCIVKHLIGDTVYFTLYGHLEKVYVNKGQRVNTGDVIGKGGNTGKSRGAHLHFELRKNKNAWSSAINAEEFFVKVLDEDEIPDWKNVVGKLSAEDVFKIAKKKRYISGHTKFNDEVSAGKLMIFLARLFPDKFKK